MDRPLFQLGVLAYEGSRAADARGLMERRLELARGSGDADRIAQARRDLDTLYDKLAHDGVR